MRNNDFSMKSPDKFPMEFVLTFLIPSEILEVIYRVKTQKVHHIP